MARTTHIAGSDVTAFLVAHGLTTAGLDVAGAADYARAWIERGTNRQWLADSAFSTRLYDPPTGPHGILFPDEFVALNDTTPLVYVPLNGGSYAYVAGFDYSLYPENAAAKGLPFDEIRFRRRWSQPLPPSLLQSIQISAKWGRAATLPEPVWKAELAAAALYLESAIVRSLNRGIIRMTDSNGRTTQWQPGQLREEWQADCDAVLNSPLYCRITF